MSVLDSKNKNKPLPPMPGAIPLPADKSLIKGVPFIIYINGKPIEMSKREALSVMGQILNIQMYMEEQEGNEMPLPPGVL